ncbi:ricin-type beta-trefoil lectin domain protein [Streptomyces varsoviensis]|uniref:ricin-type beta-trefoil lectin domain protein n=1 Tax=Streptomyces varsoviensis TaxID=67373 RepID=UPI0033C078BD
METEQARALREAAETGKPVEVLSERAETTQVVANPDGSFTRKEYVRPVYAKVDGNWKQADPTLRKRTDGRIEPAGATFGLSFSGGGDGPLATMEKSGKSLSLTWPKTLPAPQLEGDVAIYPDVLPDVDLRIQADVDGFAQHLVVKSREAARLPDLTELSFGLKGNGTDLKADGQGNLTVTDASGSELFTAPAPVMWDSSGPSTVARAGNGFGHASRPRRDEAVASDKFGQGAGAEDDQETPPRRLVQMSTKVVDDTLRIAPDAGFLRAPDTVFPVVIDPIFSGGGRNNWAIAYKQDGTSLASTPFWNGGSFSDKLARVGHESRTEGTARSYFQMDTKGLGGATILSATFNVLNSYSWSCTATPVEFGWTDPISRATTWNNQPTWHKTLQTKSFAHGWTGTSSTCKSGAGVDFADRSLKDVVQKAANANNTSLTFGLRSRSDYEGDVKSWKKFHNNPHLEVTYNHPPKVDSSAAFQGAWSLGASGNQRVACSNDPAKWPTVGRNDLTLTAKVSDPDGEQVTAAFAVWEYGGERITSPTAKVSSGGIAHVTVPISKLQDGKRYKWIVQAKDAISTSPWTSHCGFNVDKTSPVKPTVTAADGFALDKAEVPAREERKIRLVSSDEFGLDGFCYTLNKALSTSNAKCQGGTFVKADKDGAALISIRPSLWPNNRLHVQAYDKAGNLSPYDGNRDALRSNTTLIVTKQPDYVHDADGSQHGDLAGDLNGDGYADLLAPDSDGNLVFYGGKGDGSLEQGRIVDHGGWNGAQIAHHGDFISTTDGQSKDGFEDYFVKIGNKLYLYPGDGSGMPLTDKRKELIHPTKKQTGPLIGSGGKCVDIKDASVENGAAVRAWTCNGSAAQDFELTDRQLKVLGKCVDVPDAKGTNGAVVQLYTCNDTNAQEWLDRGDGSLYNPVSGRCLDLPQNNTDNGTRFTVHDCNQTEAQRFDVPGSWTGVKQILAVGDADGRPGGDLIVDEGGKLVLYTGSAEGPLAADTGTYKLKPGTPVSGSYDPNIEFIAPGDVNGDGIPDLLGRLAADADHDDKNYGKLLLFPGERKSDSEGNSVYALGTPVPYGDSGWDKGNIPSFASSGNAQGRVVDSGKGYKQFVPTSGQATPDFWATSPGGVYGTGVLRFYPGTPTAHGTPVEVGDGGWTSHIVGIF